MRNWIITLLLVAGLTAPVLAAPGNGNGNNANDAGAGNGSENAGSSANSGGNQPSAGEKVSKVFNDNTIARDVVRQHQYLSLEEVTELVANSSVGRVLDYALVLYEGVLAYQITVLEPNGRLHRLIVNARSGVRMKPD